MQYRSAVNFETLSILCQYTVQTRGYGYGMDWISAIWSRISGHVWYSIPGPDINCTGNVQYNIYPSFNNFCWYFLNRLNGATPDIRHLSGHGPDIRQMENLVFPYLKLKTQDFVGKNTLNPKILRMVRSRDKLNIFLSILSLVRT